MQRAPPPALAAFAAGAGAALWVLRRRRGQPREGAPRGPGRARFVHDADGSRFRARFELLDELGSGAYSQVLRCRDRETGALLAAKRVDLHRSRLSRRASRDAVLAEADVHLSLSHPSVLRVEAVYEGDREVWIVTELCRGGELFDQLARRRNLSEPVARRVMLQVLSALAYLHSRGIMHRDIKPENVLLASDADGCWDVRLSDFGFARAASLEHGAATALCGSPYYCAPEVLRARSGASPYDTAADVFSAGVLLYVMLAGFLPFDQDEFVDAAHSRSSAHDAATREAGGSAHNTSASASASPGRRGGGGGGEWPQRDAAATHGPAGWSSRGGEGGSLPSASVTASFSSATTASGPASTAAHGDGAVPDFTAPVWTHVSAEARHMLASMLSRDPALRPSAAACLRSPWLRGAGVAYGACDGEAASSRGTLPSGAGGAPGWEESLLSPALGPTAVAGARPVHTQRAAAPIAAGPVGGGSAGPDCPVPKGEPEGEREEEARVRHARRAVEDTLRVAAASSEAQRAWRALEEARGLLHECPPASVAVWRCASRQREVASSLSVWLRRAQHTSHTALMLLDDALLAMQCDDSADQAAGGAEAARAHVVATLLRRLARWERTLAAEARLASSSLRDHVTSVGDLGGAIRALAAAVDSLLDAGASSSLPPPTTAAHSLASHPRHTLPYPGPATAARGAGEDAESFSVASPPRAERGHASGNATAAPLPAGDRRTVAWRTAAMMAPLFQDRAGSRGGGEGWVGGAQPESVRGSVGGRRQWRHHRTRALLEDVPGGGEGRMRGVTRGRSENSLVPQAVRASPSSSISPSPSPSPSHSSSSSSSLRTASSGGGGVAGGGGARGSGADRTQWDTAASGDAGGPTASGKGTGQHQDRVSDTGAGTAPGRSAAPERSPPFVAAQAIPVRGDDADAEITLAAPAMARGRPRPGAASGRGGGAPAVHRRTATVMGLLRKGVPGDQGEGGGRHPVGREWGVGRPAACSSGAGAVKGGTLSLRPFSSTSGAGNPAATAPAAVHGRCASAPASPASGADATWRRPSTGIADQPASDAASGAGRRDGWHGPRASAHRGGRRSSSGGGGSSGNAGEEGEGGEEEHAGVMPPLVAALEGSFPALMERSEATHCAARRVGRAEQGVQCMQGLWSRVDLVVGMLARRRELCAGLARAVQAGSTSGGGSSDGSGGTPGSWRVLLHRVWRGWWPTPTAEHAAPARPVAARAMANRLADRLLEYRCFWRALGAACRDQAHLLEAALGEAP